MCLVVMTALLVAACGSASAGSGGSTARSLLAQTFSGSHTVRSGVLDFRLTLNPSGSRTLKAPISLGLSGPFQSRGKGQLPESDFTITINAPGHRGTLGLVSTGTSGYVTLQGVAYQLPAAAFQTLASSFAGASAGSGIGGLSKSGIDPLRWLTNPSISGSDTVAGAATTHIRAGVNVPALLADLNTFLHKASAGAAAGTSAIPIPLSPATPSRSARAIESPGVDVWTGTGDKTLRKLTISLNVPVTGRFSARLGGLSAVGIRIILQYANLDQPQTISAPSNVQPFGGLVTKLRTILPQLRGGFGGAGPLSAG